MNEWYKDNGPGMTQGVGTE